MAGFYGADIDPDAATGGGVEATVRDNRRECSAKITSQLGATQWEGPDATQFRDQWRSTHTPSLNRVKTELLDTAAAVQRNWKAQETTSSGM